MDEDANLYDAEYFRSRCGSSYTRENFLPLFKNIANHIVKEIKPKTVLDAGCAMGYLVESLRDLGVEAYGFDISDYALSQVRDDIKKYVKKQSILDPIDKQYDLIVCIEILEHLPSEVAERAIENLCKNAHSVLFSSSPEDKTEPTHQNVREPGYWSSRFAKFGFFEQTNYDTSFVSVQAMLFNKMENKQDLEIINSYSNDMYLLKKTIHNKLSIINDLQTRLQRRDHQLKELDEKLIQMQNSLRFVMSGIAYDVVLKFRDIWNKIFPSVSRRRKYADALMLWMISKLLGMKNKKTSIKLKMIKLSLLTINEQYNLWLENHKISEKEIILAKKEISKFKIKPTISIIMPVYNVDKIWIEAAINSVRNQLYENWELCIVDDASSKSHIKPILEEYKKLDTRIKIQYLSKNVGIAGASNKAIELSTGDYVGFLDNDDELYLNALFEVVKRINKKPDVEILYSDEDKIDTNGQRIDPYFKADWSPDLLMTGNYITHFCVFNKLLIKSLKGFRLGYDGSQDFDLFLRATDAERKIEHIPQILYGWRKIPGSASMSLHSKPYAHTASIRALEDALDRRNIKGKVEQVKDTLHYRIRYNFGNPLVSIILTIHDDLISLKKCIRSIETTNYKNFELIILDNLHSHEITNFLKSSNHEIIQVDSKSNLSTIYNIGAHNAKGDIFLFLSDDVEPMSPDWLDTMLESSFPDKVGVVGPMLITSYNWPKFGYFIANAGSVIGVGGIASNAFSGFPIRDMYYRNLHLTIRNCSSVTGECMLIKKEIFDKIGGWDEKIHQHADIDLCLRIADNGYNIVYTPYAKLLQNQTNTHDVFNNDLFVTKWKQKLDYPDPFYNIHLSQISASYGISPYSNLPRPLAILMELYLNNNNLQRKYPEAKNGNFENLILWALRFGIQDDVSFYILRPFKTEFEQLCDAQGKKENPEISSPDYSM